MSRTVVGAEVLVPVTVIMPAYNAGKYVAEAIESVLAQTFREFRFIIINDGSTDETLEIIRRYEAKDERIEVIDQPNRGAGAARNAGIERTESEWIAFMDADDIMEPYRIERQLAFAVEKPGLALTSNLVTYIDSSGKIIGKSQPRLTTDREVAEARQSDIVIGFHHTLARREVIARVGGFRQEFWPVEDTDLWTRIADAGERVLVQPEHLTRYRIHDGSSVVRNAWQIERDLRWARQCSLNRRAGLPEMSREEFNARRAEWPFYQRWNENRKDFAAVLYKQARFYYSTRRYARTAALTAISSIVDPAYAPKHVVRTMILPRLQRSS